MADSHRKQRKAKAGIHLISRNRRRLDAWWVPRSSKPVRGRYGLWRVRFPSASATLLTWGFRLLVLYYLRILDPLKAGLVADRLQNSSLRLVSPYLLNMEWRPESWMFNDSCEVCGTKRLDHHPHQLRHPYKAPILSKSVQPEELDDWEDVPAGSADRVERAVFRHFEREATGAYDAALPSPTDRKRIRKRVGLTQQDVADQLHVSRDTVMRWEKPAGYRNGKRLPGREPVGELREAYSEVLMELVENLRGNASQVIHRSVLP